MRPGPDTRGPGIGPVRAMPRLLRGEGLTVEDIDLAALDEAVARQLPCCRDGLGIDDARLDVDGGAIAVGRPFGMTGARMTGHLLIEGRRSGAQLGVVTICVGGGQDAAALFENF